MTDFIKNPNLPKNIVKTLICGTDDIRILNYFESRNIEVIRSDENNYVDPAVKSHTDMAVLHLGDNIIVVDKGQEALIGKLREIGMEVYETAEIISGKYPRDVKLNFTIIGNNIFGNFRYIDSTVEDKLSGMNCFSVKQGYCKCSVLVLSETAAITDDESISRKMLEKGIDCLFISKGDICLDGHEYGFIGGASCKIGEDTVLFFGDITKHTDFISIDSFLSKHNCKYACTDNDALRDIGGAVPVLEFTKQNS